MKFQDENSISRQKRAKILPQRSKTDFLSLLGDAEDKMYPVYMTGNPETIIKSLFSLQLSIANLMELLSGPTLYTLCTAVIDLDEQKFEIIQGNPKKGKISHIFSLSSKDLKQEYEHNQPTFFIEASRLHAGS